ncbi:MAG TPA: helicase-related protein [Terriglobales bacterium]|nr:helicase-related protein [Candidatus Sulfotelmatobacter sp.]HUB01316.1 helicase-related protein [Terriglobales bacterium]HUN84414.1 helicase-related protein [Terracidiphilus sp.]
MSAPQSISDYLTMFASELGSRILQSFPPLQNVDDAISPRLDSLLRKPFPAQALAIMGVVKRWQQARSAAVVAECGTGKTLISLGSAHVHSEGKPYTAIAMVPPHLTEKWAREALLTIPGLRVFMIDGLRDASKDYRYGVNEVRLRRGRVVREGLQTSLPELRLRRSHASARSRWQDVVGHRPTLFVAGRDRAKLGYFWKHAYQVPQSGQFRGCVVNPDTGAPVYVHDSRLCRADFQKVRLSEIIGGEEEDGIASVPRKRRRAMFSPLWQADGTRIRRVAPLDFIGRYMPGWFDYALCDEAHQLAGGDTAQGNSLGTLASCADRIAILTGTLLGGFADDVYYLLFRLDPAEMVRRGYSWGEAGVKSFAETYGVLETITTVQPSDNACSKARVTTQVKRRPGASPRLFGDFLMELAAFVSLEDVSSELPPFDEQVISVAMDQPLKIAYRKLEDDIKVALKEHRGNQSVLSTGLNALLLYPDRPFGLGDLIGYEYDPETQRRERFLIASTEDLDENILQAKEQRLLYEVKAELGRGNRCHIYAVYTRKRDVTRRLERILCNEGISVAVLSADVPTDKREAWFERRLQEGVQVTISHPKVIETGIDLITHTCLIFYETGYSLHTLRQASRRSWRIGQRKPVRVIYLHYADTLQATCLRLMGKKMLVSLAMEGKFGAGGLQEMNDDGADILTAMAKELVTEARIGESADLVWRKVQEQNCKLSAASEATVVDVRDGSHLPTSLPQAIQRLPDIVDFQRSAIAEQLPLF